MPSRIEMNVARSVLATLRGAKRTPQGDAAAQAARRVLDGSGSSADMEVLRNYRGIRRTPGHRTVRKGVGLVRQAQGTFGAVSRDVELAAGGDLGAQVRAGFTMVDQVTGAIARNRKHLTKLGEGIAKRVGLDPSLASKFVQGLSQAGKFLGAIGVAVTAVTYTGLAYARALGEGAKAEEQMRKQWWQINSRHEANRLEGLARGEAESERWIADTGIGFVDDLLRARTSKRAADKMKQLAVLNERRRKLLLQPGSQSTARVMSDYGIPLNMLTPEEINQAIDKQSDALSPESLRRLDQTGRGLGNSFTDELTIYESEFKRFAQTQYNEMTMLERSWYEMDPEGYRNKWLMKLRQRKMDFAYGRLEAKAKAEMNALRLMSPKQRHDLMIERDEALAENLQYRSRHALVIPD